MANLLKTTLLEDSHGRRFSYLRLSLTDACNFRCVYCLPNGYQKPLEQEDALRLDEIKNLATAFSELGMWKIRLTGGEPTLRRDLIPIVEMLSAIPTVKKIALSTNGYRLKRLAPDLKRAGVQALNVSVDSLDPTRFKAATGSDQLAEILEGIETSVACGFESVKVNAVLMSGSPEEDFELFLNWIRDRKISVRFIELMPTAQNTELFQKRHLKSDALKLKLFESGWKLKLRGPADGPALEFTHPDYAGSIGVIAPYSNEFCKTCNRLRVTSLGALRLCLFAEGGHSLRHLLQDQNQKDELKQHLQLLLNKKEVSHYLPEGRYGDNRTFSSMGG